MLNHAKNGKNLASSFQSYRVFLWTVCRISTPGQKALLCCVVQQNILYVGKAGCLCENNSNLFRQLLCNALFLNEGT